MILESHKVQSTASTARAVTILCEHAVLKFKLPAIPLIFFVVHNSNYEPNCMEPFIDTY